MFEHRPAAPSSLSPGNQSGVLAGSYHWSPFPILGEIARRVSRQRVFVVSAVVAIFLLAYYFSNPFLIHRAVKIEGLPGKVIFVFLHLLAASCMLVAAVSSRKVFGVFAVASFISVLLDNCFFFVKHYPITLSDLSVLLASAGNSADAISQFHYDFIRALATASAAVLSLMLFRWIAHWQRRAGRLLVILTACSFCFYLLIAVLKGEPSLVALPSNDTLVFGAPTLYLDSKIQNFASPQPFVAKKSIEPVVSPAPKNIILVIDESIEQHVFRKLANHPFLNATDLGAALSGANCSAASNFILRVGPDDLSLSKTIRNTPTLFELAKQSNFTTLYFDLQDVLQDTAVHNYFSTQELASVDHIYHGAEFGAERFERDNNFAKQFVSLLAAQGSGRVFAIVNKMGSHFPYAYNLPPELAGTSDPYAASVSLSTMDFLHHIDSTLPPSTIVLYTSDHGQNFLTKSPHCNGASDSTRDEWNVPLIIFASPDLVAVREAINTSWVNRASHFELAETVRVLLGYQAMFNQTLFDPPGEETSHPYHAFFGPIKGLLGRPASFREFNRQDLQSTTVSPSNSYSSVQERP